MDMERVYSIYKHTNKIDGKVYIGKAKGDPKKRWGENREGYLNRKDGELLEHQYFFGRAILKHGWENFSHEILVTDLTKDEACVQEKYFIKLYHAKDPQYGYNLTDGGEGAPRRVCSE